MQALIDALAAAQRAQPQAGLREPERSADDVAWNAVVAGRGNRFEDMRQVYAVATTVAKKLRALGALPEAAMPYAPALLAGLLNFIWRSQNVNALPPEMAAGWAGTVKVAAAALARGWAPPAGALWSGALRGFPSAIDAAMQKLEACSWDDVYKHLKPEMAKLATLAAEALARVKKEQAEAYPAAMAWLMGTIVQKNVYSPLDGSVPESYCDELNELYHGLERNAEAAFFPWLGEGFRAEREKKIDRLDLLRVGVVPERKARAATRPAARKPVAAKTSRVKPRRKR
jgi:hypothetical protein